MKDKEIVDELERLVYLANRSISLYNISIEKAKEKSERKDFTLLFSHENDGFIAGYQDFESADNMFIWLFGVLPDKQGKGIGSALLWEFEKRARDKGYKKIRSYTFNRFKSKIILSLNRGYKIIKSKFDETVKDYRILLEKDL